MAKKSPLFEMNEDEEFGAPESESFPAEVNPIVSGVGIIDSDYEESDEQLTRELDALLASFNTGVSAEEIEAQEREREKYRLDEEARTAEAARKSFNEERYKEEQRKKAEREAEAEAEKLRAEAEARERKENSVTHKLFSKMKDAAGTVAEKIKLSKPTAKTEVKNNSEVVESTVTESAVEEKEISAVEEVAEDAETQSIEEQIVLTEEEFAPEPPEEIEKAQVFEEKPEKTSRSLFKKKPAKGKVPKAEAEEVDWKYIATHDDMTKLLNTRAYSEDLKKMDKKLGVVYFDINNLKYTNDNFTHEAGNRLIEGVAESLKKHFGEEHLYRTGGDEFICLVPKYKNGIIERIQENITLVHQDMKELSKKDPEKIVYAVSIGYAFGDGKHEVEDVVKAADAAMYKNKKAYKQSHPNLIARAEEKKAVAPEKPATYDDGLKPEQRKLKGKVQDGYINPDNATTREIVRDIQKHADEVLGILIASADFNHLFILTDIEQFTELVLSENAVLDYSYIYAIFEGGPRFYGQSEYYQEVTHLFEDISNALTSGRISEREIKSIKGINVFQNIYI